jgi:hypothetical protein
VELNTEIKEKSRELIFMIAFPVLNVIMNMISVVPVLNVIMNMISVVTIRNKFKLNNADKKSITISVSSWRDCPSVVASNV